MEKELGQIKFTETESGIKIEISGDKLKEKFASCCIPFCSGGAVKIECCDTKEKKEGSEKCC